MTSEGLGVWVYAIARADHMHDRADGLRGVAGESVRTILGGDLAAAVGTVGLDEFRGEELRRNFTDLDVFAVKARAHNAVVSAVRRAGPVLPVRMATIYRDDWRVCRFLLKEHEEIETGLRKISGREELGVRAYADSNGLAIHGDVLPAQAGEASARGYLSRRRRQLVFRQEDFRLAAAEADRVHAALLRCAVDGKRRPPTEQFPSGDGLRTVFNGTYLVDGDVVELFMDAVASLERSTARIRLEVTGPWPPYSFAEDLIAI
jgi:gas vesicle protein GvpL/GvpF